MIRVGMFVDTYFPMVDGVIHVVHNYAKRMNDGEFEVTVFCPVADKKFKDEFEYRVKRCKSVKVCFLDYTVPAPKFDRKFKKAVKESNLDIVHIHSPFGVAKTGIKYAKKHKIPAVATLHSQFKQDFYRSTKSKLITNIMLKSVIKVFNQCDEFYTVNKRVAEIFYEYGCKHVPLIQRNCSDCTPVEDVEAAKKLVNDTFSLSPDEKVFLFVGRINSLKNIYFLVEALSKLKDKNYRMIFVGDGGDMPTLKSKVQKFGLTDNVILPGRITDRELLKALYARSTLFLFPSMYDTNSLVQLEAATQKLPTVFLEGSATSATVTDNVSGFIAKPTPEEYAEKIEEILANEELYQAVREGAFRDLYVTWDETVAEMKNKYKTVIEQKKQALQAKKKT